MMEGYSVTEAASVLGVPTERVWELLARGVLSGKPEGETGMRVYLQPRPAPAPPEATRPNGNGGAESQRELSPFRELLTEFRSLTERYGQALLALGEARGEVAALRSRVDLLEARMDLRLPTSAAPTPAGWASTPMPFPTERTVVPTVPGPPDAGPASAEPEPEPVPGADEPHDLEEEERRARRRGPRRATESFAEALARAEDPSVPELPGAAQAAAALAALRDETEGATDSTDAALPREMPVAEAVPVADETEAEPMEVRAEPPPVEPMAEETDLEPQMLERAPEVASSVEAEATTEEPSAEGMAAEAAPAEQEPAGPQAAAGAPPLQWDAERYTTAIEDPDWFAAEVIEPDEAVEPSTAEPPVSAEAAWPAAEFEAVTPSVEPQPAELEMEFEGEEPVDVEPAAPSDIGADSEDDGGAAEMEVATTGRRPSADAPAGAPAMPGAFELDEALAALDALAGRTKPEGAPPDAGSSEDPSEEASNEPEEGLTQLRAYGEPRAPYTLRSSSPTTSSASRAYRRLRRIFPG